ncbi:Alpha/Beta hydrolase protein [Rhodofomes roseus]|uniref:Alpha/Beta hydrolase protein n=1 Tax=Rhodofomes roseus TaxID=34475 RepID=A0ABQ8JZ78_9APHY|nr:Alpha/Beta hydrolase protein [Rhodofomes roseus]KAH9829381.1 Alpha/Beta hydrolase protein [Rhodofomes roseus]
MQTITYSRVGDLEIKLDITLPPSPIIGTLPGVVHIHGGGMTTGSRSGIDCFQWLKDSTLSKGMIFMSADYRLIYPSTGLDIIEDMKALMKFLADPSFSEIYLPAGIYLDNSRIGVVGVSGGGYAARALAIYGEPKPKAVYLLYGMGGDFICDHWVADKGDAMFGRVPPPPRATLAHLLDATSVPPTSGCTLQMDHDCFADEQRRIGLFSYWWSTGELLDHVLGEPVSAMLRALPYAERAVALPERLRPALLETQIDASFPPTFLLHGGNDATVPLSESQKTYDRLREFGVKAELEIVPGGEHALMAKAWPLEFCAGADEAHEKGMRFLARELFEDTTGTPQ